MTTTGTTIPRGRNGGRRKRKLIPLRCLKCGQEFMSSNTIYNRICKACNQVNDRMAPSADLKGRD